MGVSQKLSAEIDEIRFFFFENCFRLPRFRNQSARGRWQAGNFPNFLGKGYLVAGMGVDPLPGHAAAGNVDQVDGKIF